MGAIGAIAFGFWLVACCGMTSFVRQFFRHARGRPVPLRGLCVAREQLRWPLPVLAGKSGNFRGMVWRGTADGLVCQHPDDALIAGECRPMGDRALYEARLFGGYLLITAGMIGFMLTAAVVVLLTSRRFEWVLLVPAGIILFTAGLAMVQWKKAVKDGRELARYSAGLLDELSRQSAP